MYYCRTLAIAYIEHTVLQRFHDVTLDDQTPPGVRPVLRKLCALYGLWTLNRHLAILYQGTSFYTFSIMNHKEIIQNDVPVLSRRLFVWKRASCLHAECNPQSVYTGQPKHTRIQG